MYIDESKRERICTSAAVLPVQRQDGVQWVKGCGGVGGSVCMWAGGGLVVRTLLAITFSSA